MANYVVSDTNLTAVANAIRTKGGTSASLTFPQGFVDAIGAITTGGGELQIDLSHDYMDGMEWFQGNLNAMTGVFTPDTAGTGIYWTSDYIDVEGLDQFTLLQTSAGSPMLAYGAAFFDVNKTFMQRSASAASSMSINGGIVAVIPVPSNAKYFRCATVNTIVDLMHLYSVTPGIARVGGEWTTAGILTGAEPFGDIVVSVNGAIQHYSLANRAGLLSVAAHSVTAIGNNAFQNCTGLVSIDSRELTGAIGGYCFSGCTKLQYADLGSATSIGAAAFNGCNALDTIILRRTSISALLNVSAFANCRFASGKAGGTIYIPKVLYDHLGDGTALDYKLATNWSVIDSYGTITWAKIEGSEYEL